MADEGFDLCECIWNNEMAMQRLLSILRQTQNYCTDNECFSLSRLPGPRGAPSSTDFVITCLLVGFLALMYAFRPKSLRYVRNDNNKDRDNGRDSSGDPPAPPSTAN